MVQFSPAKFNWLRLLPLAILLFILVMFFYFRIDNYLNFQTLKTYHAFLFSWTEQHYFLAVIIYIVTYTVVAAIAVPGPVFLSLTGGFLFSLWPGVLYTDIGATLGATIVFLVAKIALHDFLYRKYSGKLKRFRDNFQNNAWSYLLFLRLVPLFPFGLVNIAPAFLGIKVRTFFFSTMLGILPGTIVYVWLGSGIGEIFASGKSPNLDMIMQPNILLPILGLALLSLIPIIYKWIKRSRR